jgi:hypothetical protein
MTPRSWRSSTQRWNCTDLVFLKEDSHEIGLHRRTHSKEAGRTPAAISMYAGARFRSRCGPAKSSEETGSSNQLTARSENASARRSACLRL